MSLFVPWCDFHSPDTAGGRYRGAAKDGGTLEYVCEAGEQNNRRDRRALNRYNAWAAIRKRAKILPNPFPSGADLLHDGADVAKNKKTQVPFSAFNSAKIASV